MERKTVVFIVASNGYQPIEYNVPKKILTDSGVDVMTASDKPGMVVASDNTTTTADLSINNIIPSRYDGIFFIGGPGALEHLDNQTSYTLAEKTVAAKKLLGAICISPRILARAGVLTGKKATGWNGDNTLETVFAKYDVIYEKKDVVIDNDIITATGPAAAEEFGKAILVLLKQLPK